MWIAVAAQARVPVWFYENPSVTQVTSTFEQLAEVVSLPNVTGMKLSSSDRDLLTRCVKELQPESPVLTGYTPDFAYAGSIGAQGAIAGMGSLMPRLCVDIFEAGSRGEIRQGRAITAHDGFNIQHLWGRWLAAVAVGAEICVEEAGGAHD